MCGTSGRCGRTASVCGISPTTTASRSEPSTPYAEGKPGSTSNDAPEKSGRVALRAVSPKPSPWPVTSRTCSGQQARSAGRPVLQAQEPHHIVLPEADGAQDLHRGEEPP